MALNSYRTVSGLDISKSAEAYGIKAFHNLGTALYQECQQILSNSLPLVPVDTGTLRASGYVDEPDYQGDTHVSVQIGYGGPAAKINPKSGQSSDSYAIYVHENLEAAHKVGQAKFLEQPLNEGLEGMGPRLAAAVRSGGPTAGGQALGPTAGYNPSEE